MNNIPVIIPAYEPDERLINLLMELKSADMGPILIVNDGSNENYNQIFSRAEEILDSIPDSIVLKHDINRGKGRALKTAFEYVLSHFPNCLGVITADSDGQHTVDCIKHIQTAFLESPTSLILGSRDLDGDNVPLKSSFGNKLTSKILKISNGLDIKDTQTGLRAIPVGFLEELTELQGERFEFETRMLIATVDKYPIIEVPIQTVYDSKDNHQTHFDPIKDSIRIYKIFGESLFKFVISSLSSSIIDLLLFHLFTTLTKNLIYSVIISTAVARIISASYNYIINHTIVFSSQEKKTVSAGKYCILAVIIMSISAISVTIATKLIPFIPKVFAKAIIDTILFFISYHIQKKHIFKAK